MVQAITLLNTDKVIHGQAHPATSIGTLHGNYLSQVKTCTRLFLPSELGDLSTKSPDSNRKP